MALWSFLNPTATIAQVAGVDASGLVSMILTAVQTVRRNKEDCRQLARRAIMISDLLQKLQSQDMMQDEEVRRSLVGLDDTLREAYLLVASCHDSGTAYRFFMGWKQADQFREVQRKIDSYVELYPFVMHLDLTQRMNRLYNIVNHGGSPHQVAKEIVGSSISCSIPVARTEGSIITESRALIQTGECSTFAEHQRAVTDHEAADILSTRKRRSIWLRWRSRDEKQRSPYTPGLLRHDIKGYSAFYLSELSSATNNFAVENIIGHGSFGTVYKGQIHDGLEVAVKVCSCLLSDSNQGQLSQEYRNEVQLLMKLHHKNIVKLLGYCIDQGAMILAYEYVPNKSLDRIIFGKMGMLLEWPTRFRILKGIAHGIMYLHEHCDTPIVHGDIKPGNVLLDSDMNPKLSDFGTARMIFSSAKKEYSNNIVGTYGYIDPELVREHIYSTNNDIYSFGILLIEIIAGKRRVWLSDEEHGCGKYVHEYARELWPKGRAREIIDLPLRNKGHMAEILRCIQIGLVCTQPNRPSMWDILLMLSSESISVPSPE